MQTACVGIFRGTQEIKASSFPNKYGKMIAVPEKLEFKFDEEENSKIVERVFRVNLSEEELVNKLLQLKNYQKALFKFDIQIYSYEGKQDIKLKLTDVDTNVNEQFEQ